MKVLITALLLTLFSFPVFAEEEKNESVYDRIMRTGEIRCGYYMFQPATWIDAESGELVGFAVDIWEQLGDALDIKVIWAEEVTFGTMFEGLQTGRYDAICSPVWPNSQTARVADFTVPLFYSAVKMFVRADDHRFENKDPFKILNTESVTIAIQDGEVSAKIAQNRFPKAKTLAIPQAADPTQNELNVMNKKADVALLDTNRAELFMKKNPNALKPLSQDPVQVFPFKMAVNVGETRLINHLDIALEELHNNGIINKIIDQYDPDARLYPRIAKPYEVRK